MRPRIILAVTLICFVTPSRTVVEWELEKENAECKSDNINLGRLRNCAIALTACAAHKNPIQCKFFNFGKGAEAGRCFMETTRSDDCEEGYLSSETRDFYELKDSGEPFRGCTDKPASNYNANANLDDGSCEGVSACVSRSADGKCSNCITEGQCECPNGSRCNDGYRNPVNDTVYASKVADGAIQIDGDLRDWTNAHSPDRHYENVAFATSTGDIVVFEEHSGGKWFGPSDFSVSFMLAWDQGQLLPRRRGQG